MSALKKTPDLLTETCPFTGRHFSQDAYPTLCNCCKKVFQDRKTYWSETVPLTKGDYSYGTKGKIFEYRNCKDCKSTLVTQLADERDQTAAGERKRVAWNKQLQFLIKNGIPQARAQEILKAKK